MSDVLLLAIPRLASRCRFLLQAMGGPALLCSFLMGGLANVEVTAQETFRTRVVLLGTGTPNADPERSGPATAIVVDDRAYLVDAGAGVVRRAAMAARDREIPALRVPQLHHVFLTHLHSDHTVGLPDLLLSPWVLDRPVSLNVYGPPGTKKMMDGIVDAWSADISVRIDGPEPRDANRNAYRALTTEIEPGLVYEDDLVKVYAILVDHGGWEQPVAYRFVGPDRTIVISGDTRPSDSIVEACGGCDILVHEVYSAERFTTRPPAWQRYHSRFHTSTVELADIANRARAGLVVLYHHLFWGTDDEGLLREIRAAGYSGPLVSGRDLDVY
jgi:ribonuclease BN (tRNA processing enzyme)